MVNCGRCKKYFRDNYTLVRHQSRKNQCEEVTNTQNPKIQSLDTKIQSLDTKIQSLDTKISNCIFCLNIFSTTWYKNKHEQICKERNDPVRLLEIEQKIETVLPDSKLECRYCNKIYNNTSNLNKHLLICKEREDYHQMLKSTNVKQPLIVNNITNNNCNNTNNITILNFGQENDVANIKELQKIYNLAKRESSTLMIAGDFIVRYKELLNRQPENHNVLVSERSPFGKIHIGGKWKRSTKHRLISSSFKRSARSLSDQIDIAGISYNTEQIDEFVESGLEHPELSHRQRCQLTNDYTIQLI